MRPLDGDMAAMLHARLRKAGVDLRLGTSAAAFHPLEKGLEAELTDGQRLQADMVVLAIGVQPDGSLAKAAGLTVNSRGAIVVNDRISTQ